MQSVTWAMNDASVGVLCRKSTAYVLVYTLLRESFPPGDWPALIWIIVFFSFCFYTERLLQLISSSYDVHWYGLSHSYLYFKKANKPHFLLFQSISTHKQSDNSVLEFFKKIYGG